MLWLYLVSKNSPSINTVQVTGCANEKVAIELNAKVKHCLSSSQGTEATISSQVEKSLKRPFEVLATSASSTTSNFMEKLMQLQNQSSDKSSKSFKKIPVKYQNMMILVAASVSEVTLVNYDAKAIKFFK